MYKISVSKEVWIESEIEMLYLTLVKVSFMNEWNRHDMDRFHLQQDSCSKYRNYPSKILFQLSSSMIRYYDYETQSYIQTEYERLPSNWYDGSYNSEELKKHRQHHFSLDIDFNEFEINDIFFYENLNKEMGSHTDNEHPHDNIILNLKHPIYEYYIELRFWNVSLMRVEYETILKQKKQHWRLTDVHLGCGEDSSIKLHKRPLVFFTINGLLTCLAEGVDVYIRNWEKYNK